MTPLHLDDEALSAAVDGEATADEQDHLDGCQLCQERAAGLRAVSLVVGTPVTPRPAAAAEAAIRAAMDTPVEVSTPVGRPQAVGIGGPSPSLLSHRLARGVLALAAVAVLVLGAGLVVALAGRGPSSIKGSSLAARPAQSPAFAGPSGAAAPDGPSTSAGFGVAGQASPDAAASAKGLPIEGPDLGNQSSSADLTHIVDRQLAGAETPTATTASGAPSVAGPLCVDQGVAAAGLAGQRPTLRYVAAVRWLGQDAEVLVFDRPGGGRAGVVMRRQDCGLLTMLSL